MSLVVRTLSDRLVDVVRDRILAGSVAPDGSIRQEALAAELGVSKIPLREALTRLEQEGLIRSEPNRGYFVRALTSHEAEEVYALRLKLEPEATALAAQRASDAERRRAQNLLSDLEHSTRKATPAVGAVNRAFHLALIQPSAKELTISILERLHVLSERYVRIHLAPLGRSDRANKEHRQLLMFWLERDANAVAALTEQHIVKTLDDLRAELCRSPA